MISSFRMPLIGCTLVFSTLQSFACMPTGACYVPGWEHLSGGADRIMVPIFGSSTHCETRTLIFQFKRNNNSYELTSASIYIFENGRSDQISAVLTPATSIIRDMEVDTFWQNGKARQMCQDKQAVLPWNGAVQKALEVADPKFTSVDISPELVRFLSPADQLGTPSARFVVVDGAGSAVLNVKHSLGTPSPDRLRKIAGLSKDVFALGADGSAVLDDRFERPDGTSIPLLNKADFETRLRLANATVALETFDLDNDQDVKAAYDLLRISLVDPARALENRLRDKGLLQSALVYLQR